MESVGADQCTVIPSPVTAAATEVGAAMSGRALTDTPRLGLTLLPARARNVYWPAGRPPAFQSAMQAPDSHVTRAVTGVQLVPSQLYSKVAAAAGTTCAFSISRPATEPPDDSGAPDGSSALKESMAAGDPAPVVAVAESGALIWPPRPISAMAQEGAPAPAR